MLQRRRFTWASAPHGTGVTEGAGDIAADGVTMAAGLTGEAGAMPVGNTVDTAVVGDTVARATAGVANLNEFSALFS
jgi:hypothetical protein